MRAPIATAFAIGVGIVVVLGYFFPIPSLMGVRALLLEWGVLLAAVAVLVGVINLALTHIRRLQAPNERDSYSVVLLLGLAAALGAGLWFGPANPIYQQALLSVQIPVEAGLMALLAITLAYAALRLVQRRRGVMGLVFIFSTVVFLVLASGLLAGLENVPVLGTLIGFVNRLPTAGGRGILLGVALGSLLTGLRILVGVERPYSG